MARAWTKTERGYSQIKRGSNGIYNGMVSNRMYLLGAGENLKPKNLKIFSQTIRNLPDFVTFSYFIIPLIEQYLHLSKLILLFFKHI